MEILWVFIAIGAAFTQNLRSAMQKNIKNYLSNSATTYVRFLYALPFALIFLFLYKEMNGIELKIYEINNRFFGITILAACMQLASSLCLIWAFSFRSFAVSVGFFKMDVAFTAIIGFIIFEETISAPAAIAIAIGIIGVFMLAQNTQKIKLQNFKQKSTWIGLASAMFIGIASLLYREAINELENIGQIDFIARATMTLATILVIQNIIMGTGMVIFQKQQLSKIIKLWKYTMPIGFIAAITSLGWFCAIALQKAAYVVAIGQIELVFTFLTTIFFFKEKIKMFETIGAVLIIIAIIMIALLG